MTVILAYVKKIGSIRLSKPNLPEAACADAKNFYANFDSARAAFEACTNIDWLIWLLNEIGWPGSSREDYEKIKQAAKAEYNKIKQAAWAEYDKIEQAAWAEYNKIDQAALAEYDKIEQAAWAEYNKIKQPALANYEKIRLTWIKANISCEEMVDRLNRYNRS